jgi:hypothetical protein
LAMLHSRASSLIGNLAHVAGGAGIAAGILAGVRLFLLAVLGVFIAIQSADLIFQTTVDS